MTAATPFIARWRACTRKRKYGTEASALMGIERMRQWGDTKPMVTYHCKHCCLWHLAKWKAPRRRRRQRSRSVAIA